jgi:hypothetical protein
MKLRQNSLTQRRKGAKKASRRGLAFLSLALLCAFAPLQPIQAKEVQSHGVWFEKWVRDTFFDGYVPPSYTQKWDIPKEANTKHGGVPVNPKATKYKTPVDLGDALRQRAIEEPFILVIGYWKQDGDVKKLVNIVAPRVEVEQWQKLWGPVTMDDLKKLDAIVKDKSLSLEEARAKAREMKSAPPFTLCAITLNPKIDKSQRRLQCSLSFAKTFKLLAPDADSSEQERPTLWGVPAPPPLESGARTFEEK